MIEMMQNVFKAPVSKRPLRMAAMAAVLAGLGFGAVGLWVWQSSAKPPALSAEEYAALYQTPLPMPQTGLGVYHLGHSLKGPDIPAFLSQMADAAGLGGHRYNSQLGWGASLRDHWQGAQAVAGFDDMNHPPAWADPRMALGSGAYDALVLTEMVELKDAIRWHDSSVHLALWAELARAARPDLRIYMYESWHDLSTPDGWLERLDADPQQLWEGTILAEAMTQPSTGIVHVIPAGRVMAALVRHVEALGGVVGMTDRTDLFARNDDGSLDTIHINDVGAYLVALVHFAVIYQRSPVGLPHALVRADGSPATPPDPALAAIMQDIVWSVVRNLPVTGIDPLKE
jgi:hypothetical protein